MALTGWLLVLLGLFFWGALALAHASEAFAVIRSPWQGMLFEAVFGWIRERSGGLVPGVLAHDGVNVIWTLA